ncbi:hypothetical protein [Streptomyces sp. NPDC058466]|uniref:hypothetical protein n=1 Tax=Streptomyces sp. NPDC058466 TaxID=3346512 RepID=UPI00366260FF
MAAVQAARRARAEPGRERDPVARAEPGRERDPVARAEPGRERDPVARAGKAARAAWR